MTRQLTRLVTLAALLAAGCSTLSAQRARGKAQEAEVGGYRYRQPLEVVWPQLRRFLVDYGLTLGGKDAQEVGGAAGLLLQLSSVARETSTTPGGGLMLESNWTNGGRRWRAEGWPDAGGGCRITLTKIAENPSHRGHDDWSVRDYALELELIRRLDTEGASRIDDLLDPPAAPRPGAPASTPTPAAPAPGKTE